MPLGTNEIAQLPIIQICIALTTPSKETHTELLAPIEWSQYMSNAQFLAGSLISDEKANKTNKQKQKQKQKQKSY